MTALFPTHHHFELGCHTFIAQHQSSGTAQAIRTTHDLQAQLGWKWQDHPVYPHNGYMIRRDLKMVQPREVSSDASTIDELQENDEDPSAAHPANTGGPSHIVVEWNVVYSKTYRIPQLCFNVYDSTGALSLSELIATGIIFNRAPNPTHIHAEHLDLSPGRDNELSHMDDAFPLLQRVHHPYPRNEGTSNFAETVWSIHPCHVQDTIAEILASTPPDKSESSRHATRTSSTAAVHKLGDLTVDIDEEANQLEAQVRWLDCWFMVTSTLVNLRP